MLRGGPISTLAEQLARPELKPNILRLLKGLMTNYLPAMLTCRQFEDFILEYLENTLPKKQRRLFEFHIKTCRECKEYLAAYQRSREVAQAANRMVTSLDDVPSDLLRAVLSAM